MCTGFSPRLLQQPSSPPDSLMHQASPCSRTFENAIFSFWDHLPYLVGPGWPLISLKVFVPAWYLILRSSKFPTLVMTPDHAGAEASGNETLWPGPPVCPEDGTFAV